MTGETRGSSSATRAIRDMTHHSVAARALPRLEWQVATVVQVRDETSRARTLVLDVPRWPGHRAGQHVDVRLVAEDGYQAQRSYSIASAPEDGTIALTVERLDDGEVSPYLCNVLRPGDGLEIRGPIGGYFVWDVAMGGPLSLVGGGSGIVPLMAMLRHRARAGGTEGRPSRLLYSAKRWDEIIYREEIERLSARREIEVSFTLTRDTPTGWGGYRRRVDESMLTEVTWPPAATPHVYVCGPTAFVEVVATLLVRLGHEPTRVRTERFGPTG